ncbi:MAG: hypothetical protein ACE5KF_03070 [Kiloniellaceae bacterium]
MPKTRTIHGILFRIAPVVLVIGLVLTATEAYGYYGGHYRYGYYPYRHGGYYGGHHRYSYGHRRYGYYPYRHGGYYGGRHRYSYGHRRYGYYPYRHGGYHGGLAYGLLSIPGAVVGSLFGYHHSPYYGPSHRGGVYRGDPTAPPATGPGATGVPPNGGAYGGNSTTPPTTGPDDTGASLNRGPDAIDGGGWALLADGRYSQALSIFGAEASSRPNAGRPKVGYALSAAAGGDLRRGVWAMRRALRIDPKSIHYMTIDESLRLRVEQLIARYRDNPGRTVHNAEAAFMLASLHYLLGDTNSARTAIDLVVAGGDRNSSTSNLKRLIDTDPNSDTQRGRRAAPRPSEDGTVRSTNYY